MRKRKKDFIILPRRDRGPHVDKGGAFLFG
jgi:hypothetical protein